MGAFSNIKGLTYYGDNKDDPFVTMEAVCRCVELGPAFVLIHLAPAETRRRGVGARRARDLPHRQLASRRKDRGRRLAARGLRLRRDRGESLRPP